MWLSSLFHDLRYAARLLRLHPGFTAVAILTLAIGMGANTVVLTLVNTFALRPLPVPDPEAIVHIGMKADLGRHLFSYQDYLDYRAANRTLAGLAAANKVAALLGDAPARFGELDAMLLGSDYRMAFGRIVTASYFDVLGARTEIGRLFTAEEDRVPDQDAVVVLSHSFWTRQFQSDPAIIGKTVRLTGRAFTVVGVMEPGFVGTEPQIPDFWPR